MAGLKVLLIGGTGTISSAVARRALKVGHSVTVMNRGRSSLRPLEGGAQLLVADARDRAAVAAALEGQSFDVVVDFLSYVPEHVSAWVQQLRGTVGQYIFVSSASAYQKPPVRLPVTESTPLRNPYWQYSRDKIACEDLLAAAYREDGFPVTVIRPSHTYDQHSLPFQGRWTVLDRMLRGKPIVVHGDGTSLWTITHAADVAVGIVGLFGRDAALGEAFTVTGSDSPTWNRIYTAFAEAIGVEAELIHAPSEMIAQEMPEWGPAFLGDKAHSMVFDTSKIRALVPGFVQTVPFDEGARMMAGWYLSHPEAQVVDGEADAAFERIVARLA